MEVSAVCSQDRHSATSLLHIRYEVTKRYAASVEHAKKRSGDGGA